MKIHRHLLICLSAIVLCFAGFGVVSAQSPAKTKAIRVPGAVPIQFDKPVQIDAQSSAFKANGSDLHVVNIGRGTFHLSSDGHLTATLSAGVLQWENVDYWVSVTVFDSRCNLLGTASHEESVKYIRLGAAPTVLQDISFDFGVSDRYCDARYAVVAISERKSLPSE